MLPICLRFLYALHMHVILNSFFGRHKMLNHYFCLYDAMNSLNLKDASLNYCFQKLSSLSKPLCSTSILQVLSCVRFESPSLLERTLTSTVYIFCGNSKTFRQTPKHTNPRNVRSVHPKRLRLRSHEAGRETKTRFSNLVCNSTWNTSILPNLGQTNKTNSRPPERKIWKQRSAKYFLSSHLGNKRPRKTHLPPTTFSICDLTKLPPFPSLSSLMVWILDLRGRGDWNTFRLVLRS